MRGFRLLASVCVLSLLIVIAARAWAQSIQADDNIETDGQLVSNAAQGTAPLQVSSTTKVAKLNADYLDGRSFQYFASDTELQDALADPPCFNKSHRFVNCGNGTVTDTVTGLIWLENANCFGQLDWATANQAAALLFDGATIDPAGGDCDLTDGSRPGDWRLATREEWEGILDSSCASDPEIVGNGSPTPGCYGDAPANEWASGVVSSAYWSSATFSSNTTVALAAFLFLGSVDVGTKTSSVYVWPVRGGQ